MSESPHTQPLVFLQRIVDNNSAATLVFLLLAAAARLIGGNVLVAKHYRRVGKSPLSGFRPFALPFAHFNAREWGILVVLLVLSLACALTGLLFNITGGPR